MSLTPEEFDFLYKKLEYTFKKSENPLVDKIKNKTQLTEDDIKLLLKKLEYTFRKSDHPIIKKLSDSVGLDNYSPVLYGNIKQKEKRDLKEKEKEEQKKLKHLKEWNEFKN
jgi:hypothetical protein